MTPSVGRSSIDRLMRPNSVAIVGASPVKGSFGASILANLERAGYTGDIRLINPKRSEIAGRPCLATILSLPDGVDCAVLAIPRQGVLPAVRDCASRGLGAIIIFSSGFAESDAEGRAEQDEIARIAREHGMAIQGPNCLGMVNNVQGIPLTFVSTHEVKGELKGVAIVSQSGAMAAVLGVSLAEHALGISFSVSTGNEAVLHVEDFVEYLLEDAETRVITMIVEQFRKPRKFLDQIRRANTRGKRIVLLHPGRSNAARASAATHTGAMAGDYEVMRAKVSQAGAVLVDTLEELIDVTQLVLRCPVLPRGGTAVLTESGAFKALTLDFCESLGLALPALSEFTAHALQNVLPDFILPTNPLDVTAQGLVDPDLYRRTLPLILADDQYGSLVLSIILTDVETSDLKLPPILDAIRTIKSSKPIIFAGLDEGAKIPQHYVEELRGLHVCFYPTAERAFRAVACFARVAAPQKTLAVKTASVNLTSMLESGVLPEYKSKRVLAACGIPVPDGELATTPQQARRIATNIGYPVVLKAQAAALSHKSDAGGVALDLADADALTAAWDKMQRDVSYAFPGIILDGILVEAMGQRGAELIVGARNDAEWGPVILVGFGGVLAEMLQDVRLLSPDLDEDAVVAELRQLKGAALFDGFRGSSALDIHAAARIVCQLAALISREPSIQEIDINPVMVHAQGRGAVALDALMVLD